MLRLRDSNGDSASRSITSEGAFSADVIGRNIPYFRQIRNPANNIDQFWASLKAPRRKVKFRCGSPGVFWHRDVFRLSHGSLSGAVCVVSRWSLDLVSGVYNIEADICGGV